MLRALVSGGLAAHLHAARAVLVINAIGSLLVGIIFALTHEPGVTRLAADATRLFPLIAVGLLGGFTTVSTFALQILDLWQSESRAVALRIGAGAVLLCPALAALGYWGTRLIQGAG